MRIKQTAICAVCLAAMALLSACSGAKEETSGDAGAYEIRTGTEGQINDMLPELSDDTKVITVDEATRLMEQRDADGQ